jgi:hypothetical protein
VDLELGNSGTRRQRCRTRVDAELTRSTRRQFGRKEPTSGNDQGRQGAAANTTDYDIDIKIATCQICGRMYQRRTLRSERYERFMATSKFKYAIVARLAGAALAGRAGLMAFTGLTPPRRRLTDGRFTTVPAPNVRLPEITASTTLPEFGLTTMRSGVSTKARPTSVSGCSISAPEAAAAAVRDGIRTYAITPHRWPPSAAPARLSGTQRITRAILTGSRPVRGRT